jgi:alkanesulfonate monooxygenase SsuD/methylene tetrahydromethanopterin reductase-like flavin-dependent oxidoreductase (luciferase family)
MSAVDPAPGPVRVGVFPLNILAGGAPAAAATLADIAAAGLDHVCCGDHVSFNGVGFDGLVQATALATLHPTLPVHTAVYLLPLRHPSLVARQLADIDRLAPGRLVFGVGIGGEDRGEVEMCGVDPATRGVRMDECMTVIRQLLTGAPTTFQGRHINVAEAVIAPAPARPIPLIVGGRSEAAVQRAGRLGDGWLGIWVSPRRFREATEQAGREAELVGRPDYPARHAMQVWCGLAGSREAARACLAPAMERFYGLPFEQFERYCPYGSVEEVAEFLLPYVYAGCTDFNLIAQSPDEQTAIAQTAAVRRQLNERIGAPSSME